MYHDQILAPFKALFNFDAINVTLGLKHLRVSLDHGTAVNLIGKNKANPTSLIKCVNFLNKNKMKYAKKSLGQNFSRYNVTKKIINLLKLK